MCLIQSLWPNCITQSEKSLVWLLSCRWIKCFVLLVVVVIVFLFNDSNGNKNNKRWTENAKQKYLLNGFWTHYIRSFIIIFSGHFTNEMARNDVDTFSINQNYFRFPFVFFHFFMLIYTHIHWLLSILTRAAKNKNKIVYFFSQRKWNHPHTEYKRYEFPNKTDICVEFEMFK